MKTPRPNKNAFTLIELLMVIAIIGILAGILIPTVGTVREKANIAASRAQLTNYVSAITMFKSEYGFYPFADAQVNNGKQINSLNDDFVKTLSGRDGSTLSTEGGNRRSIGFHSFSESEFFLDDFDNIDDSRIADRFNNTKLFIVIDGEGDGEIRVPNVNGSGTKELKASVTAYTDDGDNGEPAYYLYN